MKMTYPIKCVFSPLHGFVFVNLVNIKALLVMIEDFKLVGHFILWLIVSPLECCFNFIIWMFFDTLARYVRFYSWICPRAHSINVFNNCKLAKYEGLFLLMFWQNLDISHIYCFHLKAVSYTHLTLPTICSV